MFQAYVSVYLLILIIVKFYQGPRRHFEFGGAKKISEVATYIKFEFSKHKIRTY